MDSLLVGQNLVAPGTLVIHVDELGYLALGVLFLAIGLATLLLTILRNASRDRSVFFFGAMSCIWGIRFLLYTSPIQLLLSDDPHGVDRVARGFTYFSGAAAFWFALAYLGPGWRSTLRGLAWFSLFFAILGSLVLAFHEDQDLLLPAFNVMILIGCSLIIITALHPRFRRQARYDGLVLGTSISVLFFVLENLRALGVVPVPFDVEWIGVLVLYLTLGRLIAVRLFTHERRLAALEAELETARRIQSSLLPETSPRISGISFATRYVPMSQVAGDLYDFVEIDDSRITVLIADVSGHGVPAALIASMVKGAFRAQDGVMADPASVLAGMNRILSGELGASFVTAGCITLDMQQGVMRYAAAGHPPMLLRRSWDTDYEQVLQNGLILGQFEEATYQSVEQPMTPGHRMVLYTDGIPEAQNARDDLYGEERMCEFLVQNQRLAGDELADALVTSVYAWTGQDRKQSLDDDLTLIVMDVLG